MPIQAALARIAPLLGAGVLGQPTRYLAFRRLQALCPDEPAWRLWAAL